VCFGNSLGLLAVVSGLCRGSCRDFHRPAAHEFDRRNVPRPWPSSLTNFGSPTTLGTCGL